jgi:uncharacterized protein (TIGR03000 family)
MPNSGFEAYPAPAGVPQMIPYAPVTPAPALNPANTGFRPYSSGSSLVSSGGTGARATVTIKLPADARLYAENKALNQSGPERQFVSPELPAGKEFVYLFRVEYDRNGETLSVARKVGVRAGALITVEFNDMTAKTAPEKNAGGGNSNTVAATPTSTTNTTPNTTVIPSVAPAARPVPPVAAAAQPVIPVAPVNNPAATAVATERATIRVKLPPGATLYVDEQRSPSTELVRQFSTPPLPAGKDFAYLMKAEVFRNGQIETFTQKVPFRAGERVDVDFTTAGR